MSKKSQSWLALLATLSLSTLWLAALLLWMGTDLPAPAAAQSLSDSTYTLTVGLVGQGTVTPTVGQHPYPAGEVVTLTAAADPGWTFEAWSGAVNDTLTETTVTMNASQAVTATFKALTYTLAVTADPVAGGMVTRAPSKTTYLYGDVVTLTAAAEPGWTFEAWSGAASGTLTETTVTMNADQAITATFACIPLTGVTIHGPTEGWVNMTYTFTATHAPLDANIAYTWNPEPDADQGSADVTYHWAETGTHTITLTATNCAGTVVTATYTITIEPHRVFLPLALHNYTPPIPLTNGDFEAAELTTGWQLSRGGFGAYGTAGPEPQLYTPDGSHGQVARLGDAGYENGAIPVGYGAIAQTFTVQGDQLSFDYHLVTQDLYEGQSGYYDTFEVSLNTPPEGVSNRDEVCKKEVVTGFNPGDGATVPVSGDGLVLCAGRVDVSQNGDFGWRTVTLELPDSLQGTNITVYFAVWGRQYDGYNAGWWNTYVDIDNVQWTTPARGQLSQGRAR